MRCYVVYIALAAWLALNAHAQSPVSADVSSRRVTVNEVFTIIIGANGSDVKEPDMSGVAEAGIVVGAPSHQSQTSIRTIQGKTTMMQSRTWRFPASIANEGTYTIPRIPVVVDGREYLTQPMTVEVTRTVEMGARPPHDTAELTIDDLAFVRAIVSKSNVYQGEPILLKLRFYTLDQYYVNVETPRAWPFPETEGFYLGVQWQQNVTEQYAGRNYRITEINQALYPAMPGELTIGAWQWQGGVRWYDARRRPQTAARMFATEPVRITVSPLPPRPANFTGAVGLFRMNVQLPEKQWTQGTPVRLSVTILGEGNPNTIGAPTMPEMPWAHISDPEVETHQQENSMEVTKSFSYLITPLDAGEQVVPPVEFTYFSPIHKDYKTERFREIPVVVQPAADNNTFVAIGGSAEEQRRRIAVFDGDMLPIITDAQALAVNMQWKTARLSTFALVSPLMPLMLLLVTQSLLKHWRRLTQDRSYKRRYYAKTKCLTAISEAPRGQDPTETLYRAINGFVGDMLDINGAGLTSSEVETLLLERNVDAEITAVLVRVLKACERARYAGRTSTDEEVNALCDTASDIVDRLHACLQEKRS
ncbi:MAG TPA: protein BatD [Candidatus Hydrogenedentes bacterium]|nr:protein BatD [Candidatus Hydrogenedentota bacterium]